MSTRATIKIEGNNYCKLYKHFDGYPSATLTWLERFNTEFTKNRGDDVPYKTAQLVRSSVTMSEEFGLDTSMTTGWGLMKYDDECGEDFVYILHKDGTVTYREDVIKN